MSIYLTLAKFAKPTNRAGTHVTRAGAWAHYYHEKPHLLPFNAPDPDTQPGEFAAWCNRNIDGWPPQNKA